MTKQQLKPKNKKSPTDEFLGLYEGKLDITTEEYLKLRKEEAKLPTNKPTTPSIIPFLLILIIAVIGVFFFVAFAYNIFYGLHLQQVATYQAIYEQQQRN